RNHAVSEQLLHARVKTEAEMCWLFNGLHRFLFEDQLVLHPEHSRNKLRERAKDLAYGVLQRSNAWSGLVGERVRDAIRRTMHPQLATSKKFGVRLVPSNNIWRTPWHSVPLFDGTRYLLVERRQAEESGAKLIMIDEKYAAYVGSHD